MVRAENSADQKKHKGSTHICQKKQYFQDPQDILENSLCTDETEAELFGRFELHVHKINSIS